MQLPQYIVAAPAVRDRMRKSSRLYQTYTVVMLRRHLMRTLATLSGIALVTLAAGADSNGVNQTRSAPPVPEAVNGWREYPLRDGVISIQPRKWRTDTIRVPVPAGKGLEYKLTMTKGEGLVYNIGYGSLEDPGKMVTEFHGHTKQINGVGDLMFYSKTGGTPQSGVFTAPWDGIHGWYLKNESAKDVVVTLELAGFYALEAK
jgi:hypothetical protein